LLQKSIRDWILRLAPLWLAFDTSLYRPQIDELTTLAQAFPDMQIVLDHVGGSLGILLNRAYSQKGRTDFFPNHRG